MRYLLGSVLLLVPALALAHPGHGHGGFGAGFAHPLLGLDHVLAMAGIGFWAARQYNLRAVLGVIAAFLGAVLLGFAVGTAQGPQVLVEFGIIGSLLVTGALIFGARRLPMAAAATIAGVFALFHGHAHGAEMAAGLSAALFASGFTLASALLLAVGAGVAVVAERLRQVRPVERLGGGVLMASGIYLLIVV
ncbi:HupE/UreJ family protein [Aquisalimonas asiatica]|uniref:Urease accessory protein n=1 Tax=Aquisalimonas asiatica TaxID=406100 RepID=A0A1H8V8M2_9GAMM|nr:HupE/UreJ family protein [Aquisalimonas asiatica]SEP11614.1 urease accessory protein [Aquisalimonas asiatica]